MNKEKIAIIGLGYVGLPLAYEYSKIHKVIGFDTNKVRIRSLELGEDLTANYSKAELLDLDNLTFTHDAESISKANIYIITVPTPVDKFNNPDLRPLVNASKLVGKNLKDNDLVIYESTVYPGCTDEVCIPILEEQSGLKINKDFYCGYSPERINPGDKKHTLTKIVKVTSGSCAKASKLVDNLYKSIVEAGTYNVNSIKTAEASKVVENTQRDLNIALMNELSLIFRRIGIDTKEVLDAAETKWNFMRFEPGLVGGHCISVDPYYLTYKSKAVGYEPEVILSGRKVNDFLGRDIAHQVIQLLNQKNKIKRSVLILGFAFKPDCSDVRNTGVFNIYTELLKFNISPDVYDPLVSAREVKNDYGVEVLPKLPRKNYDAIILAVPHKIFKDDGIEKIRSLGTKDLIFFDVKSVFKKNESTLRL